MVKEEEKEQRTKVFHMFVHTLVFPLAVGADSRKFNESWYKSLFVLKDKQETARNPKSSHTCRDNSYLMPLNDDVMAFYTQKVNLTANCTM